MFRHLAEVRYWWENTYPYVLGICAFCIFAKYGAVIAPTITKNPEKLADWYTPTAGLFAIIAGFLASFYGSIQTLADTRLKRLSRSAVFLRFIRRVKQATIVGFWLAVLSIPFIVLAPTETERWSARVVIGAWLGLVVFGICVFVRVGSMLFYVFEVEIPEDAGAG